MNNRSKRRCSLTVIALCAGTALAVGEWQRNPPQHDDHAHPEAHAPAPTPPAPTPRAAAPKAAPAAKPALTPPPPAVTRPAGPGAKPAPSTIKPPPADSPRPAPTVEADEPVTPDQALARLREGNDRWASGAVKDPNTSDARRKSVAASQKPFAAILTCADSRIPAERVFDRGVGDLFVIRVAGNIAGDHESGSIEYGVEHLHIPVLVVLGHTRCGAVAAAASHAHVEGNIASLVKAIDPAVARAQRLNPSLSDADLAAAAVRENVWQSVFDLLKSSDICREAVAKGELKVVGAVYDVAEGGVEWMGEHPWQSELIAAFTARSATTRTAAVPETPDNGHDAH